MTKDFWTSYEKLNWICSDIKRAIEDNAGDLNRALEFAEELKEKERRRLDGLYD